MDPRARLDDEPVVDLRPSPWTAHGWVMGCLVALYAGFALATWPGAHGLGRLVVVVWGAIVALLGLVTTALVAVFRRGPAPLVQAYATALGAVAALLALWLVAGSA